MTQLHFTLNIEEMTQELLNSNLNAVLKGQLITVLNAYMEAERDRCVNANSKEKTSTRQAVRNGYYERALTIPVGTLKLKVPRTREGEFSTELFERYSRMDQSLYLTMMEAVIGGMSTRKVTKLVEALVGKSVSKSLVSNTMKRLDPEIQTWTNRTLSHTSYRYLYVDAMYIKVREDHRVVSKAVYIAQAVNQENKRELVGFKVSDKESHIAWSEFFTDLRMRGFTQPELIISDAHSGLRSAIQEQFVGASWQRCVVHFLRNIITVIPRKGSEEARYLLKSIFRAPTYQHAVELKAAFIERVKADKKYAHAIRILEDGFADATQYYAFPVQAHRSIKSTNSLENINAQIRRRERVIRIFPNIASAHRLIGAVLMDINETLQNRKFF